MTASCSLERKESHARRCAAPNLPARTHDGFSASQWDALGNPGIHVFLDGGLLALGGHDHQFLARADNFSMAFENALAAVGLQTLQKLKPLIFPARAEQPVPAAGQGVSANHATNPLIHRRDI